MGNCITYSCTDCCSQKKSQDIEQDLSKTQILYLLNNSSDSQFKTQEEACNITEEKKSIEPIENEKIPGARFIRKNSETKLVVQHASQSRESQDQLIFQKHRNCKGLNTIIEVEERSLSGFKSQQSSLSFSRKQRNGGVVDNR